LDALEAIVAHLQELRALEPKAKDAGLSDRANTSYNRSWKQLTDVILASPLPDAWIELDRWCDSNHHLYGELSLAQYLDATEWTEDARSVRLANYKSLRRRAREEPQPGDEALWSNPRLLELLERLRGDERCPKGLADEVLARTRSLPKRGGDFTLAALELRRLDGGAVLLAVRFQEPEDISAYDTPLELELLRGARAEEKLVLKLEIVRPREASWIFDAAAWNALDLEPRTRLTLRIIVRGGSGYDAGSLFSP
jgi:hypothetical protein